MKTREYNLNDVSAAIAWMQRRDKRAVLPPEWFSLTGVAVDDDDGNLLAVVVVYFELTAPVAVIGWCMTNPDNPARVSYRACVAAFRHAEAMAKARGAKFMLSYLGNHGLNRIIDRLGFVRADQHIQQRFKIVG